MKKLLLTLTLLFSFIAVHAQTQTGGTTGRGTVTREGTSRKGERARYAIASLPTCNSGSVDVTVNVSDENRGQRTCRETSSGVYQWVNDDPVFRPDRFGVTGDDTDTTTAFQALVTAAASNVIQLEAGAIYKLTAKITSNAALTMKGNATNRPVINFSVGGDRVFAFASGLTGIRFENIVFSGTAAQILTFGTVNKLEFVNCSFAGATQTISGSGMSGEITPVYIALGTDVLFERCQFSNNGKSGSNGAEVYFASTTTSTYHNRITFRECTIDSNKTNFGFLLFDGQNVTFDSNVVDMNLNYIAGDNNGYGLTVYRSAYTGGELEGIRAINNKIQDCYGDGIYLKHVKAAAINNNKLYNVASGKSDFILNAAGISFDSGSDNEVSGNIIETSGASGISFTSSNTKATKNTITTCGRYGIYIRGINDNHILDGNIISDCDRGITALFAANNLKIRGNTANSNANYGMALLDTSDSEISGNTFNSNATGFQLVAGTRNIITNNTANSNSGDGISVQATKTQIKQNTTRANSNRGINSSGTGNIVSSNKYDSNGTDVLLANANAELQAVEDLSSTGIATRTATNTWAARTLTGTSNQVIITNGTGVSGNPTFSLPQDIHTSAAPTFQRVTLSFAPSASTYAVNALATSGSGGATNNLLARFAVSGVSNGLTIVENNGAMLYNVAAGSSGGAATFAVPVTLGSTGTTTATAGAATSNTQLSTITSESLTTAAGAAYTLTLTNSLITTSSRIFPSFTNATNTQGTLSLGEVTPGSGSATIVIRNIHASQALNGTIKINILVF